MNLNLNLDESGFSEFDWQMAIHGSPSAHNNAWQYGMDLINTDFGLDAPSSDDNFTPEGRPKLRDNREVNDVVKAQDQGGGGSGGDTTSDMKQLSAPSSALSTDLQQTPPSIGNHGRRSPQVVIDRSELSAAIKNTAFDAYMLHDLINSGLKSGTSNNFKREQAALLSLNAAIPADFKGDEAAGSSDEEAHRLAHAIPVKFTGDEEIGSSDDFDQEHQDFVRYAARVQPNIFKRGSLTNVESAHPHVNARAPAPVTNANTSNNTAQVSSIDALAKPFADEEINAASNITSNPASAMLKSPVNLPPTGSVTPGFQSFASNNLNAACRQQYVSPYVSNHQTGTAYNQQFPEPSHGRVLPSQGSAWAHQTQQNPITPTFQLLSPQRTDGFDIDASHLPAAQSALRSSRHNSFPRSSLVTASTLPIQHLRSSSHHSVPQSLQFTVSDLPIQYLHSSRQHAFPQSSQVVASNVLAQYPQTFHHHSFPQSWQTSPSGLPPGRPVLRSPPPHLFPQSSHMVDFNSAITQSAPQSVRHRSLPQSWQVTASEPPEQSFHNHSIPQPSQATPDALVRKSFRYGSVTQPAQNTPASPANIPMSTLSVARRLPACPGPPPSTPYVRGERCTGSTQGAKLLQNEIDEQQPTSPTTQVAPVPFSGFEAHGTVPQAKRSRKSSSQAEELSTPARKRIKVRSSYGKSEVPTLTAQEVEALEGRRTRGQKKKKAEDKN